MILHHVSHLARRTSCLPLTIVFAIAGATPVGAQAVWQDQVITLEPQLGHRVHLTESLSTPGEDTWNCMNVRIAEVNPGLRMVVPNDQSGDPDRIRHMLRLAQDLVVAAVLEAGGPIGESWQNGTLSAIEFRLFPANPVMSPVPCDTEPCETLPFRGVLVEDVGGTQVWRAYVYCFDEEQFGRRMDFFTNMMGAPLQERTIWLGDLAHSSGTGDFSLRIQGARNVLCGDARTSGTLRFMGVGNKAVDTLLWGQAFIFGGSGNQAGGIVQDPQPLALPAPAHSLAHYAGLAGAAYQSFVGDVILTGDGNGGALIDGVPVSGVIHSTGMIHVEFGEGVAGAFTLVAERGVEFYGNECTLTPAVDDLLAWSVGTLDPSSPTDNVLRLEGRLNQLTGALYSPLGDMDVLTLGSNLLGRCAAGRIRIGGSENVLSDGTAP